MHASVKGGSPGCHPKRSWLALGAQTAPDHPLIVPRLQVQQAPAHRSATASIVPAVKTSGTAAEIEFVSFTAAAHVQFARRHRRGGGASPPGGGAAPPPPLPRGGEHGNF